MVNRNWKSVCSSEISQEVGSVCNLEQGRLLRRTPGICAWGTAGRRQCWAEGESEPPSGPTSPSWHHRLSGARTHLLAGLTGKSFWLTSPAGVNEFIWAAPEERGTPFGWGYPQRDWSPKALCQECLQHPGQMVLPNRESWAAHLLVFPICKQVWSSSNVLWALAISPFLTAQPFPTCWLTGCCSCCCFLTCVKSLRARPHFLVIFFL